MKDTELEEVGLEVVANIQKGFSLLDGLSDMLKKGMLPDTMMKVGVKVGTMLVEIMKLRSENAELKAQNEGFKLEISRLQRLGIKYKIELNSLRGDNKPADITSILVKKKKV